MVKTIKILTLTLCISTFILSGINGQVVDRRGHLGLSIGPSYPLGEFAEKDTQVNPKASGANRGISVSGVSFYYLFSDNIGLTAQFTRRAFKIDKETYSPQLNGIVITNDPIVLSPLSIGPMFSMPLFDGVLQYDITGTIGFTGTSIPRQTLLGETAAEYTRFEATEFVISYGVATGFRLNVSYNFAVQVIAEYFYTKPRYNQPLIGDLEFQMSGLDFRIGIGYRVN